MQQLIEMDIIFIFLIVSQRLYHLLHIIRSYRVPHF
jgi:hypothetical protein